jgi:hypothetical protein
LRVSRNLESPVASEERSLREIIFDSLAPAAECTHGPCVHTERKRRATSFLLFALHVFFTKENDSTGESSNGRGGEREERGLTDDEAQSSVSRAN